MIKLKRVYEEPSSKDGSRPGGSAVASRLDQERAAVDLWLKDVAPSPELRKWFGHDPAKWKQFQTRYRKEFKEKKDAIRLLKQKVKNTLSPWCTGAGQGAQRGAGPKKTQGRRRFHGFDQTTGLTESDKQELPMSLASLIATGTKVWLDGVEPNEIEKNRAWGITGATSNPTIVSKIIGRGHFDGRISELIGQGLTDDQIAWELDDELVKSAQKVFLPAWERTEGNDGYVSFELDPLIEDEAAGLDNSERVRRYLELGEKWSAGHKNRMIKVPATAAGLDALEALAAAGVTINVTLMFTERQYQHRP